MFNKEIKIGKRTITPHMSEPFIVAEMACAHDGQVDKAKVLIDSAVDAGADVVQFELFEPKDNIVPMSEVHDLLCSIYFTREQWSELFEYSRARGILVSTFAYDFPSLKLGLDLKTDMIKLNSSDLSNPHMVELCAKSGLMCTVGTGSSYFEEISKTVKMALENGARDFVLMHGLQNFPTDFRNAHIRKMHILRDSFNCLVGYADHTEGDNPLSKIIDLIAVGANASVIEKHITVDRKEKGIDYQAALEPAEFKEYVELMKLAYQALGPNHLIPMKENDFSYRRFQKKSIVAARDLSAGTTITEDDIEFLRNPATPGISPMDYQAIIGKKLNTDVKKFDQLQRHFID